MFCQDVSETKDVLAKIDTLFTDDKDKKAPGIKLSSIHKAKGLESKRVWWLKLKGTNFPTKTDMQAEQEGNLCYVATTRAIDDLVYVTDK